MKNTFSGKKKPKQVFSPHLVMANTWINYKEVIPALYSQLFFFLNYLEELLQNKQAWAYGAILLRFSFRLCYFLVT